MEPAFLSLDEVLEIHEQQIDGRRLGGSLYDFLKAAGVAEFPLDETFRLDALRDLVLTPIRSRYRPRTALDYPYPLAAPVSL